MHRIAVGLAAALLIVLGCAGPARADEDPPAAPPWGVALGPMPTQWCVTTTWRARHWHMPKTRPGEVCAVLSGMWVPRRLYRVVGSEVIDGHRRTLVLRVR